MSSRLELCSDVLIDEAFYISLADFIKFEY
jgi:hypothetical protein